MSDDAFGWLLAAILFALTLGVALLILTGRAVLIGWGDAPRWLQASALVLGVWLLPALWMVAGWRRDD